MPPPFDQDLFYEIWRALQDAKVAEHVYQKGLRRSRARWLLGPNCLALRIKWEMRRRLVPPAERSEAARLQGVAEWYNAFGQRTIAAGLFDPEPGRCFPVSERSYRRYLAIVETGGQVLEAVLSLQLDLDEAAGFTRRRKRAGAWEPDMDRITSPELRELVTEYSVAHGVAGEGSEAEQGPLTRTTKAYINHVVEWAASGVMPKGEADLPGGGSAQQRRALHSWNTFLTRMGVNAAAWEGGGGQQPPAQQQLDPVAAQQHHQDGLPPQPHHHQHQQDETPYHPLADAGWATMMGALGTTKAMNEDRCCFTWEQDVQSAFGPLSIFAVFDGHGGYQVSEWLASKHNQYLVAQLRSCLALYPAVWTPNLVSAVEATIAQAYRHLDRMILTAGIRGGSTATVCFVLGGRLFAANIGDSRTLLVGSDGSVMLRTIDQTHNDALEQQRLVDAGATVGQGYAWIRPGRGLGMSRSLGDADFKTSRGRSGPPPIVPDPICYTCTLDGRAAFLLLASDGLWNTLSIDEAARLTQQLLIEHKDASIVAQYLMRYAASARRMLRGDTRGVGGLDGRKQGCQPDLHLPPSRTMLAFQAQPRLVPQLRQDDVTVLVVLLRRFWE